MSSPTDTRDGEADDPSGDDAELFNRYATTRDRALRNEIVERHIGLAKLIASRFARTRDTDEDLRQVAMIGLLKAVDRFDPSFGHTFAAFAGRTIEGELKRHFRDTTWAVRVPRGAKELHLTVRRAVDELQQRNGRTPNVDELAQHLRIDRDEVLRGLTATAAYHVQTIDVDAGDEGSPADRLGALAVDDVELDRAVDHHIVGELMARLPAREQEIVRLRFYDQLSQSEIASIVGISQMHVSRLLRRAFEQMREWLALGGPTGG